MFFPSTFPLSILCFPHFDALPRFYQRAVEADQSEKLFSGEEDMGKRPHLSAIERVLLLYRSLECFYLHILNALSVAQNICLNMMMSIW